MSLLVRPWVDLLVTTLKDPVAAYGFGTTGCNIQYLRSYKSPLQLC